MSSPLLIAEYVHSESGIQDQQTNEPSERGMKLVAKPPPRRPPRRLATYSDERLFPMGHRMGICSWRTMFPPRHAGQRFCGRKRDQKKAGGGACLKKLMRERLLFLFRPTLDRPGSFIRRRFGFISGPSGFSSFTAAVSPILFPLCGGGLRHFGRGRGAFDHNFQTPNNIGVQPQFNFVLTQCANRAFKVDFSLVQRDIELRL